MSVGVVREPQKDKLRLSFFLCRYGSCEGRPSGLFGFFGLSMRIAGIEASCLTKGAWFDALMRSPQQLIGEAFLMLAILSAFHLSSNGPTREARQTP